MEKEKLLGFIKRYNLNGSIESVQLDSNLSNNSISTKFASEEKYILGTVVLNKVNFGDATLGVYDTTKLKSLLGVLGSDIDVSTTKSNDRVVSVSLKDKNMSANFMLSDLSVIPKTPNLKNLPSWDVVIKLDKDFVSRFVKAKNALPEVSTFTLLMNNKTSKLELVLGYASINSNRISMAVETLNGMDSVTKTISFSAKYFKEVLSANIDSDNAELKVSCQGLAYTSFSSEDYDAEYYLTEVRLGE